MWVLALSPHSFSLGSWYTERIVRHGVAYRNRHGKENSRGELLLTYGTDILGFFLVAMLGFLPLFIVHWASRQPDKRTWPRRPRHILSAFKVWGLVEWANWFSSLRLW